MTHPCARAGQGLIQFVRGTHSGTPYAMKFCITPSAFQIERSVYGNAELAHVVPRVAATVANADGSFADPDGTPMPPCIIIERGRAIDEWAARVKPGVPAVAQVGPPTTPHIQQQCALHCVTQDMCLKSKLP